MAHCNLSGLMRAMLMVIFYSGNAAMTVICTLASKDGISSVVVVAYRLTFAAAFILPLALILERKGRPKLTRMVLFHAFFCGLFGGALSQNLFAKSIALSSPAYAIAMNNLIPAITFVLAIALRKESTQGLRKVAGKVKIFGLLTGTSGAVFFTFYKGIHIKPAWSGHVNILHPSGIQNTHVAAAAATTTTNCDQEYKKNILGFIAALAHCICYSIWLIIQDKLCEIYPCRYSNAALVLIMATMQGIVFGLCTQRDWSPRQLGWSYTLVAVAFPGMMVASIFCLTISTVRTSGPLFVSIFSPVSLLVVTILASLTLEEQWRLGSILGSILFVLGYYMVFWAKRQEAKQEEEEKEVLPKSSCKVDSVDTVTVTVTDAESPVKSLANSDQKA